MNPMPLVVGDRYTDGQDVGVVEAIGGAPCVVIRRDGRIVKTVSRWSLKKQKMKKIEEDG